MSPEPEVPPLVTSLRVLAVDDDAVNRRVLEIILEMVDAQVVLAANGAEAIAAFRDSSFDIVLMDLQMPVMDGFAAIAEIRRHESRAGRQRTPVLVVTANSLCEHAQAATQAGADGYAEKPVTPTSLFAAMQRAMSLASSGQ